MSDRDGYKVGYRRPPVHTRWQKGQSGNPSGGRVRGSRNFKTELEEELNELVQISEGGTGRVVSKQRGILKRAVEKAMKGDMRAADLVIRWMDQHLDVEPEDDPVERLDDGDRSILDRYVAGRRDAEAADVSEVDSE